MNENPSLRERSGSVDHNSKLISFLYELLRDGLPSGTVERMVRNSSEPSIEYTNGWLANYAADLAARLSDNPPPAATGEPPDEFDHEHWGLG